MNHEKILLIEDDKSLSRSLDLYLKSEGFEVETKETLKDAHNSLQHLPILILLDWTLPDGQGIDFLKELRKKNNIVIGTPKLPFSKNRDFSVRAVDKINDLQPDLIFFTGDLVNNIATEAVGFVPVFQQLKAKHGVYSILGNHDYGDYAAWPDAESKIANLEMLKQIHHEMGWRLLMNEHIQLEKNGEKIVVAGVENWSARGRFHSYGKLDKALNGIQDAMTVLLLSHDPSHWEAEVLNHPAKVDITFSGHTHGMQFGFELFNIKWSPVKYMYKQWAGLYSKNNQHLYVNRGFGVIGYPGRVGILPEITLFTLHGENEV